jgi:hypothetical protein
MVSKLFHLLCISSLFVIFESARPSMAEEATIVKSIAGRSLAEWAGQLDSENEIVRARAAKTLPQFGKAADADLQTALNDTSPAVQYWAACGFGLIGGASPEAIALLEKLEAKESEQPAVAMAAAYALCQISNQADIQPHLDILLEQVQIPDRAIACSAADLLMKLGPKAKRATEVLEQVHANHTGTNGQQGVDYHIRGATLNALREISDDWKDK